MKPKKITKKLKLNKETIAELNSYEKRAIKGGKPSTRVGCCTQYATGCFPVTFGEC